MLFLKTEETDRMLVSDAACGGFQGSGALSPPIIRHGQVRRALQVAGREDKTSLPTLKMPKASDSLPEGSRLATKHELEEPGLARCTRTYRCSKSTPRRLQEDTPLEGPGQTDTVSLRVETRINIQGSQDGVAFSP